MGFFLTIVLTFTTTLAWFYDSDWASKHINMAGTVGIEIRRESNPGDPEGTNLRTSGTGNLYFHLAGTTDPNAKGYPGQAIDVSASVYNNGGKSGDGGSECYVRAHFAVYTDIGKLPKAEDYDGGASSLAYIKAKDEILKLAGLTSSSSADSISQAIANAGLVADDYDGASNSKAYKEDLATAQLEADMNAEALYEFLNNLIEQQNDLNTGADPTGYSWVYYQEEGALPLSATGAAEDDIEYYIDGKKVKDSAHDSGNTAASQVDDVTKVKDKGYFYLCESPVGVLKPLGVKSSAVFLWNNTFVIPWKLTNNSADKIIFVGVTFQAIQTFIPIMNANGTIMGNANNQLPANQCTYNHQSVQTVFNSCAFEEIETDVNINGTIVHFGNPDLYDTVSTPSA